jgi:hypothetical protein
VAAKDTDHDAGCHRTRSTVKGAAILLGGYIAMYLAVVGIAHCLTSPDATAALAPNSSTAPPAAASTSASPANVGESLPSDLLGQGSEPTNNFREGRPSAAIDSKCMCD